MFTFEKRDILYYLNFLAICLISSNINMNYLGSGILSNYYFFFNTIQHTNIEEMLYFLKNNKSNVAPTVEALA